LSAGAAFYLLTSRAVPSHAHFRRAEPRLALPRLPSHAQPRQDRPCRDAPQPAL